MYQFRCNHFGDLVSSDKTITAAVRSKVQACSHFIAGISRLNHAADIDVRLLFVVSCVGSDPRDLLIIISEKSYWLCMCLTE
jgi:hypothetical protein